MKIRLLKYTGTTIEAIASLRSCFTNLDNKAAKKILKHLPFSMEILDENIALLQELKLNFEVNCVVEKPLLKRQYKQGEIARFQYIQDIDSLISDLQMVKETIEDKNIIDVRVNIEGDYDDIAGSLVITGQWLESEEEAKKRQETEDYQKKYRRDMYEKLKAEFEKE